MKPIKPPAAIPAATPPSVASTSTKAEDVSDSVVWACILFLLGVIALIVLLALHVVDANLRAAELELQAAALRVQAETTPTSMSFDCDFAIDGNFQLDKINMSIRSKGLADDPAFNQLQVTHVDARCSGNIHLPARLLAEVMDG